MMSLIDMLNKAQDGGAMNEIAGQFGLDQDQMNKAVEALMPAFSTGLKRNTATPDALGGFMNALSSGNHAEYFENAAKAYSPDGIADGNNILGHLFGSKEVSRAVAAQAAATTGIGQDILKKLLPVLATTIMGGMFNQTNDKMGKMSGQSGNVFGDLMSQMMGGAGASSNDNPLGQILGGFLGGGSKAQDNPLGKIMEGMLGGAKSSGVNPLESMFGTSGKESTGASPYDELFGKMFETGKTVQDEYQKNVENIFDNFLTGMKK